MVCTAVRIGFKMGVTLPNFQMSPRGTPVSRDVLYIVVNGFQIIFPKYIASLVEILSGPGVFHPVSWT